LIDRLIYPIGRQYGEGIEKKVDDVAALIASMVAGKLIDTHDK